MIPLVWIFADQLQDAAGFDRLSAQDRVHALARGLLQPVHHPHAADAGVHRRAAARRPPAYDDRARTRNMVIAGPSNYPAALRQFADHRLRLDLPARWSWARWRPTASRASRVPLTDDLLFFILSTRMMPPIAVAIPIYLMYRELGLSDTAARHDPALHGGQRLARGLAAQGLHRRDPARIRGSRR